MLTACTRCTSRAIEGSDVPSASSMLVLIGDGPPHQGFATVALGLAWVLSSFLQHACQKCHSLQGNFPTLLRGKHPARLVNGEFEQSRQRSLHMTDNCAAPTDSRPKTSEMGLMASQGVPRGQGMARSVSDAILKYGCTSRASL